MKGILLVLLFSGQLEYKSFEYQPRDWDGDKGITNEEIVLSCSERAEGWFGYPTGSRMLTKLVDFLIERSYTV